MANSTCGRQPKGCVCRSSHPVVSYLTREINGLEPAPFYCSSPIKVSKVIDNGGLALISLRFTFLLIAS